MKKSHIFFHAVTVLIRCDLLDVYIASTELDSLFHFCVYTLCVCLLFMIFWDSKCADLFFCDLSFSLHCVFSGSGLVRCLRYIWRFYSNQFVTGKKIWNIFADLFWKSIWTLEGFSYNIFQFSAMMQVWGAPGCVTNVAY